MQPDRIKAATVCTIDIIQDERGRFYVCEFNQGLQSGGSGAEWERVYQELESLFPGALIDDYEKQKHQLDYVRPVHPVSAEQLRCLDAPGLIIFRQDLDATQEFKLRYRYRDYNPIIVDPLPLRAVYKDKAYAAVLDEDGLFPPSAILTEHEIRSGALLEHFSPDQWVIIKCPRQEGRIGTTFAYAGDTNIPLSDKNEGRYYIVQPVIPTKGLTDENDNEHYNTALRLHLIMTETTQGDPGRLLCFGSALESKEPSRCKNSGSVFSARPFIEVDGKLQEVTLDINELFDVDKLQKFIGGHIVPFMWQIISQPFDKLVKAKLNKAKQNGDLLRARILEDLLQDDRWYFPLDASPWPTTRLLNKFKKASLIATQHLADLSGRLPKSLRKTMPSGRTHERPLRVNIPGQVEKPNEYFIRKSLGLQ